MVGFFIALGAIVLMLSGGLAFVWIRTPEIQRQVREQEQAERNRAVRS
jgi:hypothetical protein